MARPKNPNKQPDSNAVRVARAQAKNVAAGLCLTSGRHGAATKGKFCLLCWAKRRAARSDQSVDEILALEAIRVELAAERDDDAPTTSQADAVRETAGNP